MASPQPSRTRIRRYCASGVCVLSLSVAALPAAAQVLGDPPDLSADFRALEQVYFIASEVTAFDRSSGEGTLQWNRYERQPSYSFAKLDLPFSRVGGNEFPGTEYAADPALPFAITFVSPRTVRLRLSSRSAHPGAWTLPGGRMSGETRSVCCLNPPGCGLK